MAGQNSTATIAVANAKGGSGKTTVACCLAAELAHRGNHVTLIDADPLGGMETWHAAGGPLSELALITDATTGVTQTAERAAADATVIIDAAGFATQTMVAVLEAADIVLIPCRASGLDATRALETADIAKEVARARNRRIPITVVMNAVTHTAIVPHIRAELENAGANVAATELHQRTAYAVAALNGTAPCWMGSTAYQAADEISRLADEIRM